MVNLHSPAEPVFRRHVFAAWSIEVPESFAETFVEEDSYWHAWDDHRSVSLTSVVLTDKGKPVRAERIARQIPPMDGLPVDEVPPGLIGVAASGAAAQPARASRALAGMLAAEGRLLIVTITCDDLQWARRVWRSIRTHPAPFPPRRERRTRRDGRRCAHPVKVP
jgi:hypothetical protein